MSHHRVPERPPRRRGLRSVYDALSAYGWLLIGPRPSPAGRTSASVDLNRPRQTPPGGAES